MVARGLGLLTLGVRFAPTYRSFARKLITSKCGGKKKKDDGVSTHLATEDNEHVGAAVLAAQRLGK
jgi:hypothetical protein